MTKVTRMTFPDRKREQRPTTFTNHSGLEIERLVNVWVPDGESDVELMLEIDIDKLVAVLGLKAYRNKTKVATECSGLVKVRVLGATKLSPATLKLSNNVPTQFVIGSDGNVYDQYGQGGPI